jgi:hypothetical protein
MAGRELSAEEKKARWAKIRRAVGALIVFAVGLAVLTGGVYCLANQLLPAADSPCPSVPDSNEPETPPTTPASLDRRAAGDDSQTATIRFGRSAQPALLDLRLEVTAEALPPESVLRVTPGSFVKDGTSTAVSVNADELSARFVGDTLVLTWCLSRPSGAHPGLYHGTLVVDDPRVRPLTIPVDLALSYEDTALMFMLLPVIGAVALLMSWNIRASRDPGEPVVAGAFFGWLLTLEGVGALVAGTAAMVGVFWATYMNATVWGATSWELFALVGALYVAFVGAAATVNVLSVPGRKSAATVAEGVAERAHR